ARSQGGEGRRSAGADGARASNRSRRSRHGGEDDAPVGGSRARVAPTIEADGEIAFARPMQIVDVRQRPRRMADKGGRRGARNSASTLRVSAQATRTSAPHD